MCTSLRLRPRFLRGKFLGAHLITFDLHCLCQCVVQTTPPQTVKMFCFVYVDCVAVCGIHKSDNEHWTLLYFSANFPSLMIQSLSLLLCDLGEIAFRHELLFNECDQEFK